MPNQRTIWPTAVAYRAAPNLKPFINAVVPPDPVFKIVRRTLLDSRAPGFKGARPVIRMQQPVPSVPQMLNHRNTGKVDPLLALIIAIAVRPCRKDHARNRFEHLTVKQFAFPQELFCPFAIGDIADDTEQGARPIDGCATGAHFHRKGAAVPAPMDRFEKDAVAVGFVHLGGGQSQGVRRTQLHDCESQQLFMIVTVGVHRRGVGFQYPSVVMPDEQDDIPAVTGKEFVAAQDLFSLLEVRYILGEDDNPADHSCSIVPGANLPPYPLHRTISPLEAVTLRPQHLASQTSAVGLPPRCRSFRGKPRNRRYRSGCGCRARSRSASNC